MLLSRFFMLGLWLWSTAPLRAETVYKVGVERLEYFPAYNFSAKGDNDSASFVILEDFAKKNKIKFVYEPEPIERLYRRYLDGELDFKYPDDPNWKGDIKKDKSIHYSEPVLEYIDGVLVKPENLGKGRDHLKKIGSVLGFTIWDYLDDIKGGKIKESTYPDFRQLLMAGLGNMVDGVYINIAVGAYQLEKNKEPGKLVFDPKLPHTQGSYKLSSLKHKTLIESFSKYLKENQAFIQATAEKYKVNIARFMPVEPKKAEKAEKAEIESKQKSDKN